MSTETVDELLCLKTLLILQQWGEKRHQPASREQDSMSFSTETGLNPSLWCWQAENLDTFPVVEGQGQGRGRVAPRRLLVNACIFVFPVQLGNAEQLNREKGSLAKSCFSPWPEVFEAGWVSLLWFKSMHSGKHGHSCRESLKVLACSACVVWQVVHTCWKLMICFAFNRGGIAQPLVFLCLPDYFLIGHTPK